MAYHNVDEDVECKMREQIDAAERRQDESINDKRLN